MMEEWKHTFVICAYKESPYLRECIESLKHQTVASCIKIVTSTPNDYISQLAGEYGLEVQVNPGEGGITQDWNWAYRQADTPYVTIAHQDDVYLPEYTSRMLAHVEKVKQPLIYFTDYQELRNGEVCQSNQLLRIKRLMLFPLKPRCFWKSKWVRRRILSMGSPICCPSVCYTRANLPEVIFENHFRSCEDWEAWEMLSRLKGSFVYDSKPLVYHRIHEESETSAIIGDNKRSDEEYVMYCKFWPKGIASMLVKAYAAGQKSNEL